MTKLGVLGARSRAVWRAAGVGVCVVGAAAGLVAQAHGQPLESVVRSKAPQAVLPVPDSLAQALAQALQHGEPLVVMVSLPGCPFCRVARNHYLEPMRRMQGAQVVQIDMRSAQGVLDFAGQRQTHDALTRAWGIKVAPTVLFFGAHGKEVAARLEGGYIADFYGAYLDERMRTAKAALQ